MLEIIGKIPQPKCTAVFYWENAFTLPKWVVWNYFYQIYQKEKAFLSLIPFFSLFLSYRLYGGIRNSFNSVQKKQVFPHQYIVISFHQVWCGLETVTQMGTRFSSHVPLHQSVICGPAPTKECEQRWHVSNSGFLRSRHAFVMLEVRTLRSILLTRYLIFK